MTKNYVLGSCGDCPGFDHGPTSTEHAQRFTSCVVPDALKKYVADTTAEAAATAIQNTSKPAKSGDKLS